MLCLGIAGVHPAALKEPRTPHGNRNSSACLTNPLPWIPLPDELASRLAGQLTESDERTRKLLEVAAYAALERALEKKHPKAQQYAEQLKTVEISEEEITRFWENNRARIQLPFHQAQPLIKTLLLQNKTQARLRGLMRSLTTSGSLILTLFTIAPSPNTCNIEPDPIPLLSHLTLEGGSIQTGNGLLGQKLVIRQTW